MPESKGGGGDGGGGGEGWHSVLVNRRRNMRIINRSVVGNCLHLCWIMSLIIGLTIRDTLAYSSSQHFPTTSSTSTVVPDESGPLSEVQTAVGLEASMPCELIPTSTGGFPDKVQLVIWYKEGNVKPIYTFDARNRELQQGIHWVDTLVLSPQTRFHYDTNPPSLRIQNVKRSDAGLYRCRVDFHKSPTRNSRINLTVLVPPTHITVLDDQGAAVLENAVGPYKDGSSINLTCMSSGGIPPPRVTWWKEHALLDDSFQILPDGSVKNVLHLTKIGRHDLHSIYTCQATNGHVVPPKSTFVKLEMRLPPLYIQMHGLNHALVAGVRTHISCSTAGARPTPTVMWSRGGTALRGATQTTSSDGNVTTSEIIFLPAPEDNGKIVTCSITTETFNGGAGLFLKDSRILDVKHAPIVSLSLGQPLNPNKLMNGSDVYLECDVKANPAIKKVEWFHNDKQLHSSRGIIISNQTLVLQAISKISHGQYMCRATNAQGSVSSNDVYLDVKYAPTCRSESTIIRAALKQVVNVTCDIDANPMSNLTYKWQFNNTLETVVDLPLVPLWTDSSMALDEVMGSPFFQPLHSSLTKGKHQQGNNLLIESKQQQQQQQHLGGKSGTNRHYHHHQKAQMKIRDENLSSGKTYPYKIESFSHFGTVTCYAENPYGHSGPCYYHILAAELPDPVKNCSAFNITSSSVQVQCLAGKNGGIPQQFHVEVVEFSAKTLLMNASFKMPEFLLKRLPSDTEIVIKVLSYNLQGSSSWYRLRTKTLPAPLLKTASSTAVLVQLTPLLGALLGIVGTLILVVAFIVVCLRMNKRRLQHKACGVGGGGAGDGNNTTQTDKGSAEPLSRNMLGSHSSLDDKNPDVIPQEATSDDEFLSEEKAFERLNNGEKILYSQALNTNSNLILTSIAEPLSSPTTHHPTLKSILNSATLTRTNSFQNKSKYGELSLTTNPSFALYNSPVRSQPAVTYSSPTSNIYTRIPARTTYGNYYEHPQQKLSPSDVNRNVESSLIMPPPSSNAATSPYLYGGSEVVIGSDNNLGIYGTNVGGTIPLLGGGGGGGGPGMGSVNQNNCGTLNSSATTPLIKPGGSYGNGGIGKAIITNHYEDFIS